MPETQRMALLLREWQGLSYAEVAERMSLTESAVEAVLFRARRNLAQKLRALDRATSFVGALLFLPGLRRLGSLTGTAKAATATVAVGLVAGTAVQPFVHPRRHSSPPPHAAVQAQSRAVPHRTVVAAAAATPDAVRLVHPAPKAQPAVHHAVVQRDVDPATVQAPTPAPAVPASSSFSLPPEQTAATEPEPTPSNGAPPPDRATTREHAPVVVTPPTPAAPDTRDVKDVVPPQLQGVLPDVPLPPPAGTIDANLPDLPAAVNSVTDTLPDVPATVTDAAPQLPNVSVPQLPSVPPLPLPESPTKGTPLQASP
jgi:hypothetical protein